MNEVPAAWDGALVRIWLERRSVAARRDQAAADRRGYEAQADYDTAAAEEAKWSALLGESRSRRTNATREVRHKTLQVAQSRLRTALNRLTPASGESITDDEVTAALDAIGL